jgi:glucan 1,3-beta-glucosidase
MPTDPREAVGACPSPAPWVGPLPPAKTGGPGAGPIDPGWAAARPWPPPAISGIPNAAVLPTYTPTAALPPLPPATFAPGVNPGNGVANPADQQQGYYTPVAGCPYPPNAWDAVMATERVCSGPAQRVFKGRYAMPRETGMPA